MPSKSPEQAKLMRAVAHGWKPTRTEGPSVSVAKEFVEADKKYTGGLAAMNLAYGGPVEMGLGGMFRQLLEQKRLQDDPDYDYEMYGPYGTEGISLADAARARGKKPGDMFATLGTFLDMKKRGWQPSFLPQGGKEGQYTKKELETLMYFPPERTGAGPGGGGPGPLPGGPPPPPRIIPTTPVTPFVPPDRRAGRDTAMSEELRAHRARVAESLSVPGSARGGHVYYDEGGAVRPGHGEGKNPYPEGSARHKLWERKHHVAPAPPPAAAEEEEERGILARLFGSTEELKSRTERELEAQGEYRGGRVGYQYGGLAMAAPGRFRPPAGGVPPRLPGGMMKPRFGGVPPGVDPRAMPPRPRPGYGGTTGQSSLPSHLQNIPPGMDPRRSGPKLQPPNILPGGGRPGPGGDGGGGIPGGPRVPPNMRGYLQRQRMQNRPAPNVGHGVNRVGQSDQQGGLARALQRGTGRPPMSRRQGFYR